MIFLHLQVAYQKSNTLATTPISESNIGNKLLHKMGWKDGEKTLV